MIKLTTLKEALQIVPEDTIWVTVRHDAWLWALASGEWNDTLHNIAVECRPKVTEVKIGSLPNTLKQGWVYRPIGEYINFNCDPIVCMKGSM